MAIKLQSERAAGQPRITSVCWRGFWAPRLHPQEGAMKTQKTARLGPNAQIHEESYCARCGGVALCESWCESVNACVRYARDVVLHPAHLSFGDQIILHALGVRWTSVGTQSIQRPA